MISVLLAILKIIGLIILWLLIIVLALLLFILISPIRYRGRADVHGKVQVQAKVSWLLHILSISFDWKDKQSDLVIRICGIPLKSKKKDGDSDSGEEDEEDGEEKDRDTEKKKKKKKGDKDASEDEASGAVKPGDQPSGDKSGKKEEKSSGKEDKSQKKEEDKPQQDEAGKAQSKDGEKPDKTEAENTQKKDAESSIAPEGNDQAGDASSGPESEKKEEESDGSSDLGEEGTDEQPEDFLQKLSKIAHKIKNAVSKAIHTFDPESPLMMKLDFITNLRTKHAVGLVLRFVGWLLKHILPRKGSGCIRYGFDDPSLTGRILAVVAATTPLHKNEITVQPDFTEAVFECDAVLKGKIVLGMIVVKAAALVLKKDVLFVIRNYKNYF